MIDMSILRGVRPARFVPSAAAAVLAAFLVVSVGSSFAQGKPYNQPMVGKNKGTPLLMINMSKDHQLSYRAYVEYADLDGDGELERSYKHSIEYYGYFDALQCYKYTSGTFVPSSYTTDKYCGGDAWSGNFLNWATMTRLDIVRRILYGGKRSVDTESMTVLERAFLPTDAHSFAKYYQGSDIAKLTPFTAVSEISICNTTLGGSGVNAASHTNTNPPIMRVAAGNYQLWNNNERWQCYWSEEKNASWAGGDPAVAKLQTGLGAETSNPSRAANGLKVGGVGPDFNVFVETCKGATEPAASTTRERCYKYPDGNRKPIGLLHEYGQENRMLFGLMTGSFEKNTSGGVLRSNVGSFRDEINADKDGSFRKSAQGIVHNLDRIRIYGYNYADGAYIALDNNCTYQLIGLTDGKCRSWGNPMSEIYTESLRYLAGKTPTAAFASSGGADAQLGLKTQPWRDPLKPSAPEHKLPGVNVCSPMHILNFNASVSSWDHVKQVDITDMGASRSAAAFTSDVGAGEGLHGSTRPIGHNGSTSDGVCTPKPITDLGTVHGLCPEAPTQQGSFLMAGAAYWARTHRIRTDLTGVPADTDQFKPLRVNTLGVAMATNTPVIEIPVPGAPGKRVTLQPTYLLDLGSTKGNGTLVDFRIAYQDIANGKGRFYVNWEDSEQGGDYDQDSSGYIKYWFSADRSKLYVETLVTGYSSSNPQGFGYIISGTAQDGPRFHSGSAGFNYTHAAAADVFRATGPAADPRESILGSARLNGAANSRINASGGCTNCRSANGWDGGGGLPTVAVHTVTGTAGDALRDPMWYAAKWGGFNDLDGDKKPLALGEWAARNRARAPFASMSDADAARVVQPDNYFFASNPGLLPAALKEALSTTEADSSRSGMSISSRTIVADVGSKVGTRAFTTTFRGDWSGDVIAFGFDAKGVPTSRATAAAKLSSVDPGTGRAIITRTGSGAVPFRWASLDAADQAKLSVSPVTGLADTLGSRRLSYLRGWATDEVLSGGPFRDRPGKLADLVNSAPLYVGAPRALQRIGAPAAGYAAFRSAQKDRTPMIYVGSNGGMLHGFDAETLAEKIAYVPRALMGKLPVLSDPAYGHEYFVDGSPFAADVSVSGTWKTLLFGSLGAGGQGMFSLDVTSPDRFSESAAADIARWEFTDADDADLGYVIGEASERADFQPNQVAVLPDGETYVVIGNGVANGSSDDHVGSGTAALFIIRAAGPKGANWARGTDYWKIPVGLTGENNGLAMPFLVDTNEDGKADVAYAGDLKGRLWKFDLNSSDPANWKVAFSGSPLFTTADPTKAGRSQPITAAPIAANLGRGIGGVFVAFGTGKYYEKADASSVSPQTIYGVWDNGTAITTQRTALVEQSFVASKYADGRTAGAEFRDLSGNQVCLSVNQPGCEAKAASAMRRGWYIDLTGGLGERVVYNPSLDQAADLIFTTTIPGEIEACDSDGTTWYLRMRLLSGGSLNEVLFDTNNDGKLDSADARSSGSQKAGVRKGLRLVQDRPDCTGIDCKRGPCYGMQGTGSGGVGRDFTACAQLDSGRLNWREIVR